MRDAGAATDCVIALDVGGTNMKGAVLDRALRPLRTTRRPTPCRAGPDTVVTAIVATLRELYDAADARGATVHGVGVVVPGIVDEKSQMAVYSANLGWRDLPLTDRLTPALGLPVVLGHDVRAGGTAESRIGAARGTGDALFLAIGTGISAAVFIDGHPVRAGGYGGELGHLTVEPDGKPCVCGGRGCLETIASAAAIAADYTARTNRRVDGAAAVAALLRAGDCDAQAVWGRAVDALAVALATVGAILAPELVVLGGGLAQADKLLLDPLRDRLAGRLTFQRRPSLVRAALGDQAGCLGAGLLAWQRAHEPVAELHEQADGTRRWAL
ncbi:ROK family protein [Streptomyces halobius]|uniref:ROK family protein n=1 Tax=Streptomyces halobius TaxID=2879846 RepID=A0ABY4M2V9_9ACTN|nr:ROK family protein [Streptomyces halobius]UQA92055.1 ROK family protein [Streptomyces halobius]